MKLVYTFLILFFFSLPVWAQTLSSTPSPGSSTSIGSISQSILSVPKTMTYGISVLNTSNSNTRLNYTSISSSNSMFTVTSTTGQINKNSSQAETVTFTVAPGTAAGTYSTTITVTSNNSDNSINTRSFTLTATVTATPVCTAKEDGNWNSASTWDCGVVPVCGDSIVIPDGYTVTINSNITTYSACDVAINVEGELFFSDPGQLALTIDTKVYVSATGLVNTSSSCNCSQISFGGGAAEWKGSDGPVSGPTIITDGWEPLPLYLFELSAKQLDNTNTAELKWVAQQEHINDKYLIQKSTDGINFEVFETIDAKGYVATSTPYFAYDQLSDVDKTFYRIVTVDQFHKSKISNVVYIDNNANADFTLDFYPNPSNKGSDLVFSIVGEGAATMTISDLSGIEIAQYDFELNGNHIFVSDAQRSKLNTGIYIVTLTQTDHKLVKKLIVN